MPKFAQTLREEEKAALLAYVAMKKGAHGCQVEACRLAAAGQLPGIPEPFKVSSSHLSELLKKAEEERLIDLEMGADPVAGAAHAILKTEMGRMARASRQGKLNPTKAREMARALVELQRLIKTPGNGAQEAQEPLEKDAKSPGDLIDRLSGKNPRETGQQQHSGERAGGPEQATAENAGPDEAQQDGETEDEGQAPVRSRAGNLRHLVAPTSGLDRAAGAGG